MKSLYIGLNGRIVVEDVSSNTRLIEQPDGLHPITPEHIYMSDEHEVASWGPDDSMVVIFQGFTAPETYGTGITKEQLEQQMKDDFILKLHLFKQPISKVFWRRLSGYLITGAMLFLSIGIIGVVAALGYAVIRVVVG